MYHVGACMTCSWRLRAEAPDRESSQAVALMLLLSLAACVANWPIGNALHRSTTPQGEYVICVSVCLLTTVYSTIWCLFACVAYAVIPAGHVPTRSMSKYCKYT